METANDAEEFANEPLSILEEIKPLVQDPILLPAEHANERVFPAIALTMIICTFVYNFSFSIAKRLIPKSRLHDRRRMCYQFTNITTNTFLSLTGLYFEYVLLPKNATTREKIQGQEDFYIFSSVQIGYQAWSLVVGTFLVGEKVEMLFHHVAVVCVGSMSGFLTNGFRYWTPYFFGIFELSSVPLGIMNVFKENEAWIKSHPTLYTSIRILFAISFLYVRVVMLMPRQFIYLRDCFLVPYLMDNEHIAFRIYLFMVWANSCFLSVLQMFWAYLIVNGIILAFFQKKEIAKEKDQ